MALFMLIIVGITRFINKNEDVVDYVVTASTRKLLISVIESHEEELEKFVIRVFQEYYLDNPTPTSTSSSED